MGSEHTLLPMKHSSSAGSVTLPRFRLGALSPVPCGKAGLGVTCPDSGDPASAPVAGFNHSRVFRATLLLQKTDFEAGR